jgi:aminoglycoside phosphotransferase (APT) family kinase protein
MIDPAGKERPGEELDRAALASYLAVDAATLEVQQFPSGHSNLTYLVRAGERELVLRRPPHGRVAKSAHDMGREVGVLTQLAPVFPAPRPIAYCEDAGVLGAPFYVMERLRGVILRRDPPRELGLTPERVRALGVSFVDQLARLHALDYRAIGLGELGKPEGYVERQVSGWMRRYADARTDDIPAMERAGSWLLERMRRPGGAGLVHNDYKYDNLVLGVDDLTRIVGVLDWEMSTVGDPLMDFGTTLAYWVEASDPPELERVRMCATTLPGSLTRAELVARYAEASGRDVADMAFYYCFGLFKNAVVAQQIYARFRAGQTKDARFGKLIDGVRGLAQAAVRVAESGSI